MKKKPVSTTGTFQTPDGLDLFFRCVRHEHPTAVLIFIHGMAEHTGRYQYPLTYFSERNYTIYAMDLRGHGESSGLRVYAESMDQLVEDVDLFVSQVIENEPKKKVFLIGHSFGGQLVLNYISRHPKGVSGFLVSSPNIRLRVKVPFWKLCLAPVLSRFLPKLTMGNEIDPALVSHDPQVVEAYRRDKKVIKKITTRLADIVLSDHQHIMSLAPSIKTPAFLMHAGADRICDPQGTENFFNRMKVKDKTLKIYPDFYHELFNELDRETVFADMERWIEKRT